MSSDRQIEANRLNALKSSGPSSPEGRARSSQNSLRHGLLSQSILLDGESKERFDLLVAGLRDEFQPRNSTEDGLVETLAVARWRQLRAWALESSTINREIRSQCNSSEDQDPATRAGTAFRALCDQSRYLEIIGRYETRYDRQYNRTLDRLLRLRKKSDFAKRTQFLGSPTLFRTGITFGPGCIGPGSQHRQRDYAPGEHRLRQLCDQYLAAGSKYLIRQSVNLIESTRFNISCTFKAPWAASSQTSTAMATR